jgi:hypothetical protein
MIAQRGEGRAKVRGASTAKSFVLQIGKSNEESQAAERLSDRSGSGGGKKDEKEKRGPALPSGRDLPPGSQHRRAGGCEELAAHNEEGDQDRRR